MARDAAKVRIGNIWFTIKFERVVLTGGPLYKDNLALAEQFEEVTGIHLVRDDQAGIWYIDKIGGQQLYKVYHKGGVVGDDATLKQDEVFAKLQKGEIVLNKDQQEGLYRVLDYAETTMGQYGDLYGKMSYNNDTLPYSQMHDQMMKDVAQAQNSIVDNSVMNITNAPNITINANQKLDDAEIKRLSNKISDYTIGRINDSFYKRGKVQVRPLLKP